jgi:hypothetical protein
VSELAVLAPEVEASLAADAAQASAVPVNMHDALAAVVIELRAEAGRRDGDPATPAPLLRELADRLAQPRAWLGVDRLVHQLLGDCLADALGGRDDGPGASAARVVALKALARHAPLWPGAAARSGCPYTYDSLLADVRLIAMRA